MTLTPRQLEVLTFIRANEPCAQYEVSEGCHVSIHTATVWCRQLKALGMIDYLERQSPGLGPERSVWLTDAGREALAESYTKTI
jgi:DNA-binding MarR family transcriptional regulator